MAMKLVKKTADYSIYKRSDDRYAVKDANKQAVNGEEKVKILLAEELIKVAVPAEPVEEEAAAEEEVAAEGEAPEAAAEEEAPAEEAPAAEEDAKEE
jgi:hypothetical protein